MSTKRVKRAFFNEDKKITKLNLKKNFKRNQFGNIKSFIKSFDKSKI